jgi:hypothetical protein
VSLCLLCVANLMHESTGPDLVGSIAASYSGYSEFSFGSETDSLDSDASDFPQYNQANAAKLAVCWAYVLTLKMEATRSSETSMNFCRITSSNCKVYIEITRQL